MCIEIKIMHETYGRPYFWRPGSKSSSPRWPDMQQGLLNGKNHCRGQAILKMSASFCMSPGEFEAHLSSGD
jgi:myo-inositol catabolism protein IolC